MARIRSRAAVVRVRPALCAVVAATLLACAGGDGPKRSRKAELDYPPDAFSEEIRRRVPGIPDRLAQAPFIVPPELVERAEDHVMRAPAGPPRVQALVQFLAMPRPEGLELVYDWAATGTAAQTLELRRGNCVSLASVLVGLGRGMGWPMYYAEARTRRPEEQSFEELTALSDHMAVVILPRTFKMVVDFTGLLDEVEDLRPIDDLKAYAHIVNNRAAHRLLRTSDTVEPSDWRAASNGFRFATRIEPGLGRAWNNLGIALSRLGQFDEARAAYERAVELDTAFGSAERNLTVMETRLLGEAKIGPAAPPRDAPVPGETP